MRTHRAKSGYLPAEYIPPTFLTRTPSPFCAGWRWGLLSRKIFLIFIFQILARIHRMSGLRIFFYFLVSPIRFLLVFYFFYFSDFRLVIQYKLSFRLAYKFRLIFTRLIFVIFSSYQFRLVSVLQILRFDSSTLYLFNSSACYKQTSMLMWFVLCLFWLFLGFLTCFCLF